MCEPDDELIRNISPDVLRVLKARQFFSALDDRLSPEDATRKAHVCHGDHEISKAILTDLNFDGQDFNDVLEVLKSQGGCCDCEVLYNVADKSRLRQKYWKDKAVENQARHSLPISEMPEDHPGGR